MLWFILLLIMLGGGFYGYYKLREIEGQIRAEQAREKEQAQRAQKRETGEGSATPKDQKGAATRQGMRGKNAGAVSPEPSSEAAGESAVLRAVQSQPGIVQSDLYAQFPAAGKKQLQQQIKQMADAGHIKRVSHRSSYRLYPA